MNKNEVNQKEQNYDSIIKLVNYCEDGVNEQSVMDFLMEEALKKDDAETEELRIMKKCVLLFTRHLEIFKN